MSATSTSAEPVNTVDRNTDATSIEEGMALCLSGGGYRAMVFHVGVLIRLNEVGILSQLKRVSSVSGGSITAAVLGMNWKRLGFANGVAANLDAQLVQPIRKLAGETIDSGSIITGLLTPGKTIAEKIAKAYKKHLFGDATLQDLPADTEGPRFVINATNVQTGALWRFSRPYMGDYRVGRVMNPSTSLAVSVGASSAFPPVLSPAVVSMEGQSFVPDPTADLQRKPFTDEVVLSDGGVYDNLGLETAWKRYRTIFVSDGGGKMQPQPVPDHNWAQHGLRINEIIDNQVRSLRKRQLIDAFKVKSAHDGTYWGIRTHLNDYPKPGILPCPEDKVQELASTPTRLQKLEARHQERLMNWGYAVCAAALDSYFMHSPEVPANFPYPGGI
ncbi:MAG: patatin-like phospholipase family protein [Verrucomicrobiales bacterium]